MNNQQRINCSISCGGIKLTNRISSQEKIRILKLPILFIHCLFILFCTELEWELITAQQKLFIKCMQMVIRIHSIFMISFSRQTIFYNNFSFTSRFFLFPLCILVERIFVLCTPHLTHSKHRSCLTRHLTILENGQSYNLPELYGFFKPISRNSW